MQIINFLPQNRERITQLLEKWSTHRIPEERPRLDIFLLPFPTNYLHPQIQLWLNYDPTLNESAKVLLLPRGMFHPAKAIGILFHHPLDQLIITETETEGMDVAVKLVQFTTREQQEWVNVVEIFKETGWTVFQKPKAVFLKATEMQAKRDVPSHLESSMPSY